MVRKKSMDYLDKQRFNACLLSNTQFTKTYRIIEDAFCVEFVEPGKGEIDQLLTEAAELSKDLPKTLARRKIKDLELGLYVKTLKLPKFTLVYSRNASGSDFDFVSETAYTIIISYLNNFKELLGQLSLEHIGPRNELEAFVMKHKQREQNGTKKYNT